MFAAMKKSLAAACALTILSIFLSAPGCSKKSNNPVTPPPPTDTTKITDAMRPIVFVHGFLEASDSYVAATQFMIMNGYTDAKMFPFDFVDYLNGNEPDIQKMANQLKTEIDMVIQQTSTDRVDIVAHAKGAQAVQYYLTKLEGKN